jgi:hypothetical protein
MSTPNVVSRRAPLAFSLLLVLAIAAGCSSRPLPEDEPGAGAVLFNKAAVVAAPGDLTPQEYVRRGVPPAGRPWTAQEMVQAAAAIVRMAKEDPAALPRYRDERSGAVFAKLVDVSAILAALEDRGAPLKDRLEEAARAVQGVGVVSVVYIDAQIRKVAPLPRECIELAGANLRVTAPAMELVNGFLSGLDRNDPTYATRALGRDKMRRAAANTMTGFVMMIAGGMGDEEGRRSAIAHMLDTFPRIAPQLTPEWREAVAENLREYVVLCPDLVPVRNAFEKAAAAARD